VLLLISRIRSLIADTNESELFMMLRLVLLGTATLALLLAACGPAPQLRDETLLADQSLLTGELCGPPCWNGITPGETIWRDAVTIIEDDPAFSNFRSETAENSPAIGAAWSIAGGPECCQMGAQDGRTVNLIFLRTRPAMSIGQVINVHGEPDYAIGSGLSDDQAVIHVVYPELQIIALVFVAGEQANISASSESVGLLYTSESEMNLFLQTQNLHRWQGYGPFSEYRMAEDADYDVTPSMTLTPAPGQ
jgi:hypothetical protein